MATKKKNLIGYCVNSKLRCVKVYLKETKTGKKQRVLHNGKKLKKGKRVYKTKKECDRKILKLKEKRNKKPKTKVVRKRKVSRFGKSQCYFEVPYFGGFVPSVGKYWSGTPNTGISSGAWMWPAPGAKAIDTQQGSWRNLKLAPRA